MFNVYYGFFWGYGKEFFLVGGGVLGVLGGGLV